ERTQRSFANQDDDEDDDEEELVAWLAEDDFSALAESPVFRRTSWSVLWLSANAVPRLVGLPAVELLEALGGSAVAVVVVVLSDPFLVAFPVLAAGSILDCVPTATPWVEVAADGADGREGG